MEVCIRLKRGSGDGRTDPDQINETPSSEAFAVIGIGLRSQCGWSFVDNPGAQTFLDRKLPCRLASHLFQGSGRGAAWLAHLHGVQGVVGSNPAAPTNLKNRLHSQSGGGFFFLGGSMVALPHYRGHSRIRVEFSFAK